MSVGDRVDYRANPDIGGVVEEIVFNNNGHGIRWVKVRYGEGRKQLASGQCWFYPHELVVR